MPSVHRIDRDYDGETSRRKLANLAFLESDITLRSTTFRGMPDVVHLLTTEVCNLKCIMCPRSERLGTRRLGRGVLARTLDELFPTARKAIVSPFHGEPLVSDFDLVLEKAREYGVKLDIVTNGVLLTSDRYRDAAATLDCVNVSVDSHVPEIYERIRDGARFERLESNLRAIREARRRAADGVTLTLSAVVMRSTLPHLDGFIDFAAEHGADGVVLQPLRQFQKRLPEEDPLGEAVPALPPAREAACPRAGARDSAAARALRARLLGLGERARARGINLYFGDFSLPAIESRPVRRKVENTVDSLEACWFVMRNFALFFTGDVYPCCYPTDHVLGNVMRDAPASIWNGRRAMALRRAHFERTGTAFCNGCLHAPYLPARKAGIAGSLLRQSRLAAAHVVGIVSRRIGSARPEPERPDSPTYAMPQRPVTESH